MLSVQGEDGFKKSFRDDALVAEWAVVDPDLLATCPPELIAADGMDAFTQLLESFVSTRANPVTDALARSGIMAVKDSLLALHREQSAAARDKMAYASLMSGICLAQTGLGSVHGLAAPLGAFFPIPHGVVCGTLVATATAVNIAAMEAREPDNPALPKYAEIGRRFAMQKGLNGTRRARLPGDDAAAVGRATAAAAPVRLPCRQRRLFAHRRQLPRQQHEDQSDRAHRRRDHANSGGPTLTMDIHSKPIQQRIDWLFDLADRHGANYRSPEAWLARERYLAEHPTAIAVLKCMDGRINIPVATNTPVGILMPFRNLGGMFDLGWPHLGEVLAHHVQRMVSSRPPRALPHHLPLLEGRSAARLRRLQLTTPKRPSPTPTRSAARSSTSSAPGTAPSIRWSAASRPTRTR